MVKCAVQTGHALQEIINSPKDNENFRNVGQLENNHQMNWYTSWEVVDDKTG